MYEVVLKRGDAKSVGLAEIAEGFFSFLVSTSLFLAINGALKLYFSFKLYNVQYVPSLLIATFLMIFGVYGINKLTDLKEDLINTPERANLILKIRKVFKFLIILSFASSLILGLMVSVLTIPVLLAPLFAGILYSIRFSPNLPRLKDITAVKNIIIALSWGFGAALLPAICYPKELIVILLIFYFFTLRSFINSVLFDVRDVEGDSRSKILTIPVTIGVKNTEKLLLILNSTFVPWLIAAYYLNLFTEHVLAVLAFAIVYSFAYILYFCNSKKIGKKLDLLVDGEWILLISLLFIGSNLTSFQKSF